jgi:CrcB protein
MSYLLVFIGGGLGSLCRFGIAKIISPLNPSFPWATFLANVLSCIILGILVGMSLKGNLNNHYKLMLMTGFCGGFSTFSTFTNETLELFQAGEFFYAFSNIFFSLIVCLICIYLGIKIVS